MWGGGSGSPLSYILPGAPKKSGVIGGGVWAIDPGNFRRANGSIRGGGQIDLILPNDWAFHFYESD